MLYFVEYFVEHIPPLAVMERNGDLWIRVCRYPIINQTVVVDYAATWFIVFNRDNSDSKNSITNLMIDDNPVFSEVEVIVALPVHDLLLSAATGRFIDYASARSMMSSR